MRVTPEPVPAPAARPRRVPAVLVSELFPPAVGGSAVLFENVYSRFRDTDVVVLTDPASSPVAAGARGNFRVRHARLATPHWGLLDVRGLLHHLRTARRIREVARPTGALVHCGRALPEGVGAHLAHFGRGPGYLCWAHGEDLATAGTSRELTLVMERVYAGSVVVLANSHHTAAALEQLGVPGPKIHVAHPGVDTDRFRPEVDGSEVRRRFAGNGEVLLLSVGRLQRRKGHDLVLEALGMLREELPQLRYVIVGTGDEEPRLRELARERGVRDRVQFAGKVSDEDLPSYYAACDVFLMPNRQDGADIEGFGIVFLEAQACGRPVVGGRSGGVPEAVAENETGLLVGGTDAAELCSVLRRLSSSADLRRTLGYAGRARAVREFGWERTARIVEEVHREAGDRA